MSAGAASSHPWRLSSVRGAEDERAQDQDVERALEEVFVERRRAALRHSVMLLH